MHKALLPVVLVCFSFAFFRAEVSYGDDTEKATLPVEASDGEWTFRVTSSGFAPFQFPPTATSHPSGWTAAPGFAATFENSHPRKKQFNWYPNLHAQIYSPQELPVRTIVYGDTVKSDSVDPKWPFVWVEFYGRNPYSPDRISPSAANGLFIANFDVRVPAMKVGEEVTLNQTRTSKLGSSLKIWKLKLTESKGKYSLRGEMSWSPPAKAPEATVRCNAVDRLDSNQKIVVKGTVTPSRNNATFVVPLEAAPTVKAATIRFRLYQKWNREAIAANRFKIRLKVPVSPENMTLPVDAATQKPTFFEADGFSGLIENDGSYWKSYWKSYWTGSLWIKDATDSSLLWKVKSSQFTFPGGQKSQPRTIGYAEKPRFHRDGTASTGNEWLQRFTVPFPKLKTRPKTVTLDAELEARRTIRTDFVLKCPIPKPSAYIQLDTDVSTSTGIDLKLVGAYSYLDPSDINGLINESHDQIPARGVAIILKGTSFTENPTVFTCFTEASRGFARDTDGRSLDVNGGIHWRNCHAMKKFMVGKGYFTAFIPSPAANADEIELAGVCYEESRPTKTAKLHVENIAVVSAPLAKPVAN